MSYSTSPAQRLEAGVLPSGVVSPLDAVERRNVAIWIDQDSAILQAFQPGGPEGSDWHRKHRSPEEEDGWWQARIQSLPQESAQQYLDAVLGRLGPLDEVLILGPDETKQDLCRRIESSGGRRGCVVGLCDAKALASAELVVPLAPATARSEASTERQEQGLAQGRGAGS